MAWRITRDHIRNIERGEPSAVGIYGPRNAERPDDNADCQFRLYDDDGNLYYEGTADCCEEEDDMFAPLLDFGTPNAGCTQIAWQEDDGDFRLI